ncbi:MAG: glycoside hydrolase family 3 N-terminal domain-containing protein, partial [Bacteroidales bacterium]|nr:glycoside hydrolase family 3 N-terminal domain-containing protein [Bacteroidales bacterium]
MYKSTYKILRFLCIIFLLIFINKTGILKSKTISESSLVDYVSWPDSVLQTMSLEEKIAQLLILRISSDKTISETQSIMDTIQKYQVGGVCFFQGGIARQALITNQIQKTSKIPLFVSIDAEWGLAMRLDSVELFPRQMALGASYDTTLIYEMGAEIARQCKRMGIHINYASCIDVNSNSKNPVINSRSFGEDPHLVAACGIAYMKGMQDNGVMPVAKHFPGHGDTDMDSHYKLPTIKHNRQRLDTIELLPFQKAINSGINGIMVGHLNVPALDTSANSISSTSKTIIRSLLIDSMHFSGLIITDGLEMKGIADYYPAGELEVNALEAGNHMLLLPAYPYIVIEKIKEAIQQGILTEEDINEKCLNVLRMKEKYVLPNYKVIDTTHLFEDINSKRAENIYQGLTESSITLLKNDNDIIPFQTIPESPVLHFRIDNSNRTDLETLLSKYIPLETKRISNSDLVRNQNELLNYRDSGGFVIVSLHNTSQYPKNNYGLTTEAISFLDTLSKKSKIIFLVMGNPYLLDNIPFTDRFAAIIIAYHPVPQAEKAVAEALCGLIQIQGTLPISLANYPYKTGIQPNKTSISKIDFPVIDSLATLGIQKKAYPGCRILIAHKGDIIYNKSFGKHTYTGNIPVKEKDVYDLASITKVAATTLAIMKLYDTDKIKLHDKLSEYLPYLIGTNKEDISIAEVLTHTAGLKAWIP